MAEESTKKKGRLAAAVLAGSALAFSSFAVGVPAALADEEPTPALATTPPESEETVEGPTEARSSSQDDTATEEIDNAEGNDLGEEVDSSAPVTDAPASSEATPAQSAAPRIQPFNNGDGEGGDEVPENPQEDEVTQEGLEFSIDPTFGPAGARINFEGSGFTPEGYVDIFVTDDADDDRQANHEPVYADEQGNISGWTEITDLYEPGLYTVTATDTRSTYSVSAVFHVTNANMIISPATIGDDQFVSSGVTATVTGLQEGDVVEFSATGGETELGGSATANADGVAEYVFQGGDYFFVGSYDVRAQLAGGQGDLGESSFEVTSAAPHVETSSPEALESGAIPQGGLLEITGNATSNNEVTIDFGLEGVAAEVVDTDATGDFEWDITLPEDAEPGVKTLTVTDEATGQTATTSYTVAEVVEDVEPSLTADRTQITLDDFVGSPDSGAGVGFIVEGLEPNTSFTYTATTSGPVADLEETETTDADGFASFSVSGDDSVDDLSVYLGRYSVTVTYEDEAGETHELGPVTFHVVEELAEGPQIELESDEVYQGGTLDVEVWNLTTEGEVKVEWNPTETFIADANGEIDVELPIADDADTGVQTLIVTDLETQESTSVEYTVLEAVDVVDPALTIDPERIELDDFIGEPEDGAGVTHTVEGLEPGTEISYVITGPEYVNDYESTATAEADGVASFVIHGYDVTNPAVYLGEYNTVVTYVDDEDETQTLTGSFTVVDGDDDSTGGTGGSDDDRGTTGPVDLNGASGLAQTGANGIQLGLLAGGLLLAGGALLAFANRKRLFGRTA